MWTYAVYSCASPVAVQESLNTAGIGRTVEVSSCAPVGCTPIRMVYIGQPGEAVRVVTVQAIQHRRFSVHGLVIGAWPSDPGLAERHNRDDLARYTGVPLLGAVPEGAGRLAPEDFRAQAPSWLLPLNRD